MRSWTVLQCFLLVIILIIVPFAVADDYDDEGQFGGSTEKTEDESSGGMVDEGGISQTSTDFTEEDPGFSLYLRMELYCHQPDRSTMDELVAVSYDQQESYIYVDDLLEYVTSYDFLPPFLPYNSDHSKYTGFFDSEDNLYVWYDSLAPEISLQTSSEDPFENAKIHRFEGEEDDMYWEWEYNGCIAHVGALTNVGVTDENPTGTPLSIFV